MCNYLLQLWEAVYTLTMHLRTSLDREASDASTGPCSFFPRTSQSQSISKIFHSFSITHFFPYIFREYIFENVTIAAFLSPLLSFSIAIFHDICWTYAPSFQKSDELYRLLVLIQKTWILLLCFKLTTSGPKHYGETGNKEQRFHWQQHTMM